MKRRESKLPLILTLIVLTIIVVKAYNYVKEQQSITAQAAPEAAVTQIQPEPEATMLAKPAPVSAVQVDQPNVPTAPAVSAPIQEVRPGPRPANPTAPAGREMEKVWRVVEGTKTDGQ